MNKLLFYESIRRFEKLTKLLFDLLLSSPSTKNIFISILNSITLLLSFSRENSIIEISLFSASRDRSSKTISDITNLITSQQVQNIINTTITTTIINAVNSTLSNL